MKPHNSPQWQRGKRLAISGFKQWYLKSCEAKMDDNFVKLQLSHGGTTSTPSEWNYLRDVRFSLRLWCDLFCISIDRWLQIQSIAKPDSTTGKNRQYSYIQWRGTPVWSGFEFQYLRATCWEGCCDDALVSSAWHLEATGCCKTFRFPCYFCYECLSSGAACRRSGEWRWCRKTRLLFLALSLHVIRKAQLTICTIFVIICAQEKR